MTLKIFCIGSQWRGSDDGSLFRALSRAGHLINIADDKYYIPTELTSFKSKVIRKLGIRYFMNEFNVYLRQQVENFVPDLVFVYKGNSIYGNTLKYFKEMRIPVICVYPDTSFYDQGIHIPSCIPYYDFIFTTKSFGLRELEEKSGYTKAAFIQHCVDPDIHRPISLETDRARELACDVSFIGTFSPKKEKIMVELVQRLPGITIKLWGFGWHQSQAPEIEKIWQRQPIYGDIYALAISLSKINLGILYEGSSSAKLRDHITSRSFHIPGAGGFLLHERTDEFLQLFKEGTEAACFSNREELFEKIMYYLFHDEERRQIAAAGHIAVMREHTSDHRVTQIVNTLIKENIL